jgi:hypothetical protein
MNKIFRRAIILNELELLINHDVTYLGFHNGCRVSICIWTRSCGLKRIEKRVKSEGGSHAGWIRTIVEW